MSAYIVARKSAKRNATFNSHGHSAEGAKRETVFPKSIGNTVHRVWMDAGASYVVDIFMFFRKYVDV